VEHDTQQRRIDVKTAIVANEAQFPEFVHQEVDPGASGPNHQDRPRIFGRFSGDFGANLRGDRGRTSTYTLDNRPAYLKKRWSLGFWTRGRVLHDLL
jgi:hypothetical protein